MKLGDLPKPFLVLAPMDDVTDTVFRQVIADCAPPDLFVTEFVNVDGLQSPGREALLPRLRFTATEKPIIAQLWGKTPENYYKTARELVDGTLLDEIEWRSRRSGLSKMQGSKEKRASRTDSTVSEARTQLTPQFAKSNDRVGGFAAEQNITARASEGFDGIDINMGCPVKAVVKNGCCAALIDNRGLAGEIIAAVREGVGDHFPLSVKTRLGLREIDLTWHEFLLQQKLNMLTIHGRTARELSSVPPHWDAVNEIREMRDQLFPATLIVGNGDVMNRAQGLELLDTYQIDGIMIGRGVFHDPFAFATSQSPWAGFTKAQRIAMYRKHVELFAATWRHGERKIHTLNKFCKIYINGFDGAKEFRDRLMRATSVNELVALLSSPDV